MDTGLLGAMIGATLFGALLSWWERGPDGLATSKRSEARHLLPWVGLRLLAALVAARGLITVLTWPAGRALGALCFLLSLPYLFPWPFARLAILRGRLGWAEGLGRLAAAHFRGATHLAGLAARAWAAWLHDDQADLRASTERLEAWSFGPESVLCRAALAELSGNPDEARLLLDSLDDFGKASLSIPLRPWLRQLRAGLPEAKAALAAPDEGLVPPAVAASLDDDAAGVDEWRTRWADEVDVQSLLAQARKQLAQWVSPPSPSFAPSSADWGAELEAFRAFWEPRVDKVLVREMISNVGLNTPSEVLWPGWDARWPCAHFFRRVVINHRGIMKACPIDWEQRTTHAAVADTPIHDAWHGDWYWSHRMMHLNDAIPVGDACLDCKDWAGTPWTLGYEKVVAALKGRAA